MFEISDNTRPIILMIITLTVLATAIICAATVANLTNQLQIDDARQVAIQDQAAIRAKTQASKINAWNLALILALSTLAALPVYAWLRLVYQPYVELIAQYPQARLTIKRQSAGTTPRRLPIRSETYLPPTTTSPDYIRENERTQPMDRNLSPAGMIWAYRQYPIDQALSLGLLFYSQKFGQTPTHAEVHPDDIAAAGGAFTPPLGLTIHTLSNLQRRHAILYTINPTTTQEATNQ